MCNYNEFAESELNKLNPIQDKYNVDSFSNWFYDSDLEILRLYNNDKDEIFFKYIPIGTFSLTKRTWMWSWFNNYLNEKNKSETLKIKNFGLNQNYKKLYEDTFPSDEYDGWEFLAISLTLLNGIGVYNIQTENINYYLLITEKIDSKNSSEIKLLKQKTLDCENHGFQRPAFVCQHLNLETAVGFEEAFDTFQGMELDEDDNLQAWCNECEKTRQKHGEWNEESEKFAQIKLICENCYFEMKNLNDKTLKIILNQLKLTPETIDFKEVINYIDENYDFTPTKFTNGNTINEANENNGSCKIFSFAKLNDLSKEETLNLFGAFYRNDVLENLDGEDHQNIRNFMKFGWDGIAFDGEALRDR